MNQDKESSLVRSFGDDGWLMVYYMALPKVKLEWGDY
jgi:hypothetical protein